ncbi:hypothetical protein LT493_24570 [Streptomyces tricolor]|nr:hypothetical protein [Streptomyces tricolor]
MKEAAPAVLGATAVELHRHSTRLVPPLQPGEHLLGQANTVAERPAAQPPATAAGRAGCEAAASCAPGNGLLSVGGDWYDVYDIEAEHLPAPLPPRADDHRLLPRRPPPQPHPDLRRCPQPAAAAPSRRRRRHLSRSAPQATLRPPFAASHTARPPSPPARTTPLLLYTDG